MSDCGGVTSRIAVLLGAGASVDAGLPTSNQFAQRLQQSVTADLRPNSPVLMALNFVYGAMINHRTESGGDPFAAVNVETMISAIRLLANRDSHEAAPFVERWKPGVSAFVVDSAWSNDFGGERLFDALERSRRGERIDIYEISAAVREIVNDGASGDDGAEVFRKIETEILLRVRRILLEHGPVDYLAPLVDLARVQPGGLDVATLNYDLTVEHAAAAAAVEVDLGEMRRLGVRHGEGIRDGALRLFKLHGSIDWESRPSDTEPRQLPSRMLVRREDPEAQFVPAIVIGDREKLGTDGPTLGLLSAFARALENAERLVIAGYSFADDHVNRIVRDWLNEDDARTITVLDPGFGPRASGFAGDLVRHLAQATQEHDAPRLHLVPLGAKDGLARALREAPTPEPDPRFDVTVEVEGSQVRAVLRNRGSELRNVIFDVPLIYRPPAVPTPLAIAVDGAEPAAGARPLAAHVDAMGSGETIMVALTFVNDDDARRAQIHVRGDALLDSFKEWVTLPAPPQ